LVVEGVHRATGRELAREVNREGNEEKAGGKDGGMGEERWRRDRDWTAKGQFNNGGMRDEGGISTGEEGWRVITKRR
jgi:hypothetical protein